MAAKHHHNADWLINEKMIVDDVLHMCPQAEEVFKKHLGPLALSLPGSGTESIEFLSAMHDYHVDYLLKDLNEVCLKAPHKVGHF